MRPAERIPEAAEEAIRACLIPSRIRSFALCLLATAAGAIPGRATAQDVRPDSVSAPCPEGRITAIFIDNHSIYDVDKVGDGGLLGWVYGTANALHVKTRASFIRRELLFHVGDCYDPLLLEESGRLLRGYVFLARADVFAVDQPDGNKHVVVDTQDEWTTRVDLGVSFDGALRLEALEVSEENLAGQGIHASVFFRQRKERQDLGGTLRLPRLLHTRTDVFASGGRTRSGKFFAEGVAYPFVGEVGRVALRQVYGRRDELFPYVVSDPTAPYTHVLLPDLDERVEVSVAGRLGQPGNLTLLGLGLYRETLDFAGFPGSLEIARENDFGNTAPAPPDVVPGIVPQAHASSTTRVNFFIGQRNVRFVRVRGLDPLAGMQDVQLGTDVGLTVGRSIDVLSASGLDGANDIYTRFRFFAGHDPGTSYLFLNVAAEGRNVLSGGELPEGWRDVLGELDFYGYLRSRKTPSHTFFARLSGAGGWSMITPFQLTLGGRRSVRGFREEDFPGARRVLFTLEDRYFIRWPAPSVFDFGFTLFADAGRVWAGEVPWGVDTGWKGTVGGGIRFGFPAGSRGLARLDLAFPVGGGGGGPVFRVTLLEMLGLTTGFADPQLERSRRLAVGPDFFTTDRR